MLMRRDVEELAVYRPEGGVLSLYLTTDRGVYPDQEYLTIFKSLADTIEGAGEDIRRMERFLEHDFGHKARGLALFSNQEDGFWRAFELQVPVPNWLFHEPLPYIKPLLRLLDDHPKLVAALVDKERARIFEYHMGELEEKGSLRDEVHGKHKQGGWSQARFQRHHEKQVQRHLKNVSDELFSILQEEEFDRLVIGTTTPELRPTLEDALHPWLLEKLGGWFDAELSAPLDHVLAGIEEMEAEIEREEEAEHLRLFKDHIGPSETAVSGLADTLFALQEGRLDMLLLEKGFAAEGRECLACYYLYTGTQDDCPACGGETLLVDDVVDRAVRVAMDRDVSISYVEGDEEFESLGSIGGLLRF